MSLAGGVLIVLLVAVAVLSLAVAYLVKSRREWRAIADHEKARAEAAIAEVKRAELLMSRAAEVVKGANHEKAKLDSGSDADRFAESLRLVSKRP